MILVTGATGNIGSELARLLVAGGHKIRALTRDLSRIKPSSDIEWVQGDFTLPETLASALKGVEKAFFVANAGPDLAETGHRFFELAKAAGVRHAVAVSSGTIEFEPPVMIGRWHLALEERLKASGLGWTMLRPGNFASNTLRWASMIRSQGAVFAPYADGISAPIDPRDIAAVAFTSLTASGHEGKIYSITGSEEISARQQVEQIGKALGRQLRFVEVPEAGARAGMLKSGMPEFMADGVLELVRATVRPGHVFKTSTVREVTGREARTFEDWLRDNVAEFA